MQLSGASGERDGLFADSLSRVCNAFFSPQPVSKGGISICQSQNTSFNQLVRRLVRLWEP